MVTFWCGWCGATVERQDASRRVACRRCALELWGLLGIPLSAGMTPLAPGEDPGLPGAARKQFRFVDADGREVGTTQIDPLGLRASEPSERRRRGA